MLSMNMKAHYCCNSGSSPPSPTNLAPRLVSSSSSFRKQTSKGKNIQEWRSVNVSETQEILKTAPVLAQVFRRIIPGGRTTLDALAEEDEKCDTDDNLEETTLRKKSSTLKVVTEKLKDHLLRESTRSRRRSQQSVGTSDEEIGRRAELRKLRQQRIREELSQEAEYDLDAKSLPSFADGLEIAVSGLSLSKLAPDLLFPEPPPLNVGECSRNLPSRPASNQKIPENVGNNCPVIHTIPRKFSPLPPNTSGPILRQNKFPSILEPQNSSWRLVLAANSSKENLCISRKAFSAPFRLKLKGARITSLSDNLGTVHLHEPRIPRGLASPFRSSSLSSQPTDLSSYQQEPLCVSNTSTFACLEHAQHLLRTSDSFTFQPKRTCETSAEEIPSSTYLGVDGIQSSRLLSDFYSIFKRSSRIIQEPKEAPQASTSLLDLKKADSLSNNLASSKTSIHQEISSHHPPVELEDKQFKQQREITPNFTESEFTPNLLPQLPSTPRSGKFREEFNLKVDPVKTNLSRSLSLFTKLTRLGHNSNSEEASAEEVFEISCPPSVENKESETKWHLPSSNKAAADLRHIAGNFQIPTERSGNALMKKPARDHGALRDVKGVFGKLKKKEKNPGIEQIEAATDDHPHKFKEYMDVDFWKTEPEKMKLKSKVENQNFILRTYPSIQVNRFPSWSRSSGRDDPKNIASAEACNFVHVQALGNAECLEDQIDQNKSPIESLCNKKRFRQRVGEHVGRLVYKTRAKDEQITEVDGGSRGSMSTPGESESPKSKSLPFFLSALESTKEGCKQDEMKNEFKRICLDDCNIENSSLNSSILSSLYYSDFGFNQDTGFEDAKRQKFKTWSGKDETKISDKQKSLSSDGLPRQ